jgi:hypothetical protein
MRDTRVLLCIAAVLLPVAASCHDPVRVRACGVVVTDDGYVTLHATSGSPVRRTIAVPEAQMVDSIGTGRWEYRCDR